MGTTPNDHDPLDCPICSPATEELKRLVERLRADAPCNAKSGRRWAELTANLEVEAATTIEALQARVKEMEDALKAAVDCGMVPTSSAKDGGASRHVLQLHVADQIRAALAKVTS
jgi:hypothetical protein